MANNHLNKDSLDAGNISDWLDIYENLHYQMDQANMIMREYGPDSRVILFPIDSKGKFFPAMLDSHENVQRMIFTHGVRNRVHGDSYKDLTHILESGFSHQVDIDEPNSSIEFYDTKAVYFGARYHAHSSSIRDIMDDKYVLEIERSIVPICIADNAEFDLQPIRWESEKNLYRVFGADPQDMSLVIILYRYLKDETIAKERITKYNSDLEFENKRFIWKGEPLE
jgi:hypothetical protein